MFPGYFTSKFVQIALGFGGKKPRFVSSVGSCFSRVANCTSVSQLLCIYLRKPYNAIRFRNTILDPDRPGSHHISHDDICENSIPHYNNLIWTRQSRHIAAAQVIKDVDSTARFFRWMPEDFDSSGFF